MNRLPPPPPSMPDGFCRRVDRLSPDNPARLGPDGVQHHRW